MTTDVLDDLLAELHQTDAFRVAIHYESDSYDVLYRREDVAEEYTEAEFDEVVKNAILQGLDESPEQSEFTRWGHLDVTARWFHEVVLVYVPLGEWTGVILSFDRENTDSYGDLMSGVLEFVEENFRDDADTEDLAEEHFS